RRRIRPRCGNRHRYRVAPCPRVRRPRGADHLQVAGARNGTDPALTRDGPLTGLLGGSFNPAHGAHRKVSLFALAALALDEVWWLVSPGNPLKPAAGMAGLADRAASARVAARRAPIRVTAIEREIGTRFTVETLRALARR